MKAVVDSGAMLEGAISVDLVYSLRWKGDVQWLPESAGYQSADGSEIHTLGSLTVELGVGHRMIRTTLLVLSTLPVGLLLGKEFIDKTPIGESIERTVGELNQKLYSNPVFAASRIARRKGARGERPFKASGSESASSGQKADEARKLVTSFGDLFEYLQIHSESEMDTDAEELVSEAPSSEWGSFRNDGESTPASAGTQRFLMMITRKKGAETPVRPLAPTQVVGAPRPAAPATNTD